MKLVLVSDIHLTPPRTAAFTDNWVATQIWIEATAPSCVVHLGGWSIHAERSRH